MSAPIRIPSYTSFTDRFPLYPFADLRKNEARLASISRLIKAHKQNEQKADAIRDEQVKKEAEEARRAAKKAAKDAKKAEQ